MRLVNYASGLACQNKKLLGLVLKCSRAFKRFAILRMRTTVYSGILQKLLTG